MPTELTVEEHIAGFGDAVARGAAAARAAGLDAAVPTCPGWNVRDLVAHVGMVHRWSNAQLTGDPMDSDAELEAAGRADADPIAWWVAGADELSTTLRSVPDDVEAMVFLNDAPPPRRFWARRQCHEATIHAVDALAARLGRSPSGDEAAIPDSIAIDGIDELLCGFLTRGRKLAVDTARRLAVCPDGASPSWTIELSAGSPVAVRHAPGTAIDADETLTGPVVDLYLALWNRGHLPADGATVAWWSEVARIRWS
jgi:uncharacterized protein (TIGR03083 family)